MTRHPSSMPSSITPSTPPAAAAAAEPMPPNPIPSPSGRSLYIAWAAFQRRQVSMADEAGFECLFLPMSYKGRSHVRRAGHYLRLAWRTWQQLRERRPHTVWLQLPQLPLLWLVWLHRATVAPGLRIVADCHNAVFQPPWSTLPFTRAALGRADLVLVHNETVLDRALAMGLAAGRTRVLEDLPAPVPTGTPPPVPPAFAGRSRPWVLFVGSYGRDEPVAEVLQAARMLGNGVVAVTGRRVNAARNGHDIGQPPPQAVLTDYLPLPDFEALLHHADVVLALTRFDGIQLSVCNEALGFGKPMVVADTPLLRKLFGHAAVMVDAADPVAIAAGIRQAVQDAPRLQAAALELAQARRQHWRQQQWRGCRALLGRPLQEAP